MAMRLYTTRRFSGFRSYSSIFVISFIMLSILVVAGCGKSSGDGSASVDNPLETPLDDWPAAGNPDGVCAIPSAAGNEDSSQPDIVVGNGSPESCTSDAVVDAVALGGVITFDCGPDPIIITMTQTAKVFNNTGPEIVIDGGGLVTLSGNGERRILYMNTCDQDQYWTTSHCQDQDHPRLTVQNLTFIEGRVSSDDLEEGSGGAIFVRGGRFKIVNCRFFSSECTAQGPDVGGAAVRVLSQYDNQPVYVVNSTFGGSEDLGNVGSNGGALSSIGVSFTVLNSLFSHNRAIGIGASSGTPGGGNGGAIYNDGNTYTLNVCGSLMTDNEANEGGGAIFYVSNDRSGTLVVDRSTLLRNPSYEFETDPGIFVLAGDIQYRASTIE